MLLFLFQEMAKKFRTLHFRTVLPLSICVCVIVAGLLQVYRVSGIRCGTVDVTLSLIQGGNEATRGSWPFVAVLYQVSPSEFVCGATLISKKHVLTGNDDLSVFIWQTFCRKFSMKFQLLIVSNRNIQIRCVRRKI